CRRPNRHPPGWLRKKARWVLLAGKVMQFGHSSKRMAENSRFRPIFRTHRLRGAQQVTEFCNNFCRVVDTPYGLANGQEVRSGVDERPRVCGIDPTNRNARNFKHGGPPTEDRRVRAVMGWLGRGRIKGPE